MDAALPSTTQSAELERPNVRRLWLPVVLALVPVAMLRPWDLPLPAIDFASNASATMGSASLWEAYQRLTEMVREAGRHHPLLIFWIAARLHYFGESVVLWQLSHIPVLIVLAVVIFRQLERAGASHLSLAVGVSCALLDGSVFSSLELPEIGELLGVLAIMLAIALASRLSHVRSLVRGMAAVVVASTAAALLKEPFIVVVPAVLMTAGFALRRRPAATARVTRRRLAALTLAVSVAIGVFGVAPALKHRFEATTATSPSRYSFAGITPARVVNVSAGMFLPVTRNPLFPANLAYVSVTLLVAAVVLRSVPRAQDRVVQIAVFASLPLFGVLIYLPWPAFPGYYGLIGIPLQAAVIALAVDVARAHRGAVGAAIVILLAVVIGYGMLIAFNRAATMRADGRLETRLIDTVREAAAREITLVADHYPTYYAGSVGKFATIRDPNGALNIRHLDCSQAGSACSAIHPENGTFLIFPESSCLDGCRHPAARRITECAATLNYKTLRNTEICRTALLIGAQ